MSKANIVMKYTDIKNPVLGQFITRVGKIKMSNQKAGFFRHMKNEINKAMKQAAEESKVELMEAFCKKDENGKLIDAIEDGQAVGYQLDPDKQEEFMKAQEAFGKREFTFEWGPIRPSHLDGIEISAEELEAMGPLYSEEDGPGVPDGSHLSVV